MKTDPTDRARVLRVRAADGGARLSLTLELTRGGEVSHETLTLLAVRLAHLPTVGEIDEETLAYLRREDALATALAMGLRSLGASGASEVQLARKLRARGVDGEVAKCATRELRERGYLDEERSAVRAAEQGISKLWGNRRILADCRAKGFGEEAITAVRRRLAEEDSVARCRRLLQKKHRTVRENEEDAGKLIASLMRYGYTGGEIREALSAELDEI